jgi:hypothetical protein
VEQWNTGTALARRTGAIGAKRLLFAARIG